MRFTRRPALRRPLTALVATAAGAAVLVGGARVGVGTAVAVENTQQAVADAVLKDIPDCFGAAAMDPQKPCTNPELEGTMIPALAAAPKDYTHYPGCFTGITGTKLADCTFGDVDDRSIPHVVLVGDSHAQMLMPALETLVKQGKISVTAQLKGSCAWTRDPINHYNKARVDSCQAWKAKLEPWLIKQAPTTDLILTTGYARFNGGTPAEQVKSMQAAWKPLAKLGVPIVAVRDNPRHSREPAGLPRAGPRDHPHHLRLQGEGRHGQLRRLPGDGRHGQGRPSCSTSPSTTAATASARRSSAASPSTATSRT